MKGSVKAWGNWLTTLMERQRPRALKWLQRAQLVVLSVAVAAGVCGMVAASSLTEGYIRLPGWVLSWVRTDLATSGLYIALLGFCMLGIHALLSRSSPDRESALRGFATICFGLLIVGIPSMVGLDILEGQSFGTRGSRVYWCGNVGLDTQGGIVDRLAAAKGSSVEGTTLVLMANGGGHAEAAYRIAGRLSELGVTKVEAVGHCNSACALLWALAPTRAIAEFSTLGFHGPYDPSGATVQKDVDRQIEVMVRAGFKREDAARLMTYGKFEMAYLTASSPELQGVVFERSNRQIEIDRKACSRD